MALVIDSLGVEGFIRSLIEEQRMTHWQVSMQLEERFGQIRGISEASVKRFCNAKGIHRSVAKKMTFQEKDNVLRMAVDQVSFHLLQNFTILAFLRYPIKWVAYFTKIKRYNSSFKLPNAWATLLGVFQGTNLSNLLKGG